MKLPDGNGLDLLEWIQAHRFGVPVAVITAHGNVETAVRALKLGAFDFISKPLDLPALRKLIANTLRLQESIEETGRYSAMRLLGLSKPMEQLREMITKVARSQAPVHISGESGTGKELVARLIHDSGPRRAGPFVPVNCGAIPTELMESELFGHKKGSFTGAVADKEGLIRSAEGGTLFLDEVADLPLHMQVKLLRVIQEKSVRPVGELREVPVDVRILSATHRKLDELVKAGRFREDLYYRINVIELHVPALRERLDDVPLLDRFAARPGVKPDRRKGSGHQSRRRCRSCASIPIPATCGSWKISSSGPLRYARTTALNRMTSSSAARQVWNWTSSIRPPPRMACPTSSSTSSARRSSRRSSRPATTRRGRRSCWGCRSGS